MMITIVFGAGLVAGIVGTVYGPKIAKKTLGGAWKMFWG